MGMHMAILRFFFPFLIILAASVSPLLSADQPALRDLPIGLTPEEMTRLNEIGVTHINTAPPPAPIRACAEWERSTGVLVRYPLGISVALVAEMSEDVIVTTIVASDSQKTAAINAYTSGGVTMAHTEFLIAPTNSYWTRDYGPWFIFDGANQLAIVDHVYNRPRPDDDLIPSRLGTFWGMSVYGMNLNHTGGNHMADGLMRSMSTRLVYDENSSLTPHQVDSIMMAFLGNEYAVQGYVESSGIHHIDCWAKFLNPTTIMVKDVPAGDASHALLDQRAATLGQMISAWGRPYTIVRVFCPSGAAYTNSLILNDKVLVPIIGSTYDTTALRVYREAMPGYKVLGFSGSWLDDDAIHCRAMGVPDRGMLYLRHTPLSTTGDTLHDYLVSVKIDSYSGFDLIADSLKVYYRSKASYQSAPLNATAVPDSFYAYIPAQKPGAEISYYILAADESGRVETHPIIGASWAHTFKVNHPPEVVSPSSFTQWTGSEFRYYPEVTDPDDTLFAIAYAGLPAWLQRTGDSLVGTTPDSSGTASFLTIATDPYSSDTQTVTVTVSLCGDANSDSRINVADAVYLVNYIFRAGSGPSPLEAGDVNRDGNINVGDAIFIINYIFRSGPAPACPPLGKARATVR
jgi:agmatine deiminase